MSTKELIADGIRELVQKPIPEWLERTVIDCFGNKFIFEYKMGSDNKTMTYRYPELLDELQRLSKALATTKAEYDYFLTAFRKEKV